MSGRSSASLPENAHRAVISSLKKRSRMPEVYEAMIDMWDYDSQSKVQCRTYFLLPYEVFEALADEPDAWTTFPEGTALNRTRTDWANRVGLSDPENTVAVGVWGDEAPFTNKDKLLLLHWNCLSTLDDHS
eukprot:8741212-Pyramimonas_sp.AAC.1